MRSEYWPAKYCIHLTLLTNYAAISSLGRIYKPGDQLQKCCRKGDLFQGPKLGSCLTLGNELSEETHVLTKQESLLGKGTRLESSRVREPRRSALPLWLTVSGFMVMGLVSEWSLANHSNSESFLVVHISLSQDGH